MVGWESSETSSMVENGHRIEQTLNGFVGRILAGVSVEYIPTAMVDVARRTHGAYNRENKKGPGDVKGTELRIYGVNSLLEARSIVPQGNPFVLGCDLDGVVLPTKQEDYGPGASAIFQNASIRSVLPGGDVQELADRGSLDTLQGYVSQGDYVFGMTDRKKYFPYMQNIREMMEAIGIPLFPDLRRGKKDSVLNQREFASLTTQMRKWLKTSLSNEPFSQLGNICVSDMLHPLRWLSPYDRNGGEGTFIARVQQVLNSSFPTIQVDPQLIFVNPFFKEPVEFDPNYNAFVPS